MKISDGKQALLTSNQPISTRNITFYSNNCIIVYIIYTNYTTKDIKQRNNQVYEIKSPSVIALLLLILLAITMIVNIFYDIRMKRAKTRLKEVTDYDIDAPGWILAMLGIGSLLMWILWLIIPINEIRKGRIIEDNKIVLLGMGLVTIGSFLSITARIARGNHAVGWGLSDEIPLITSGPYRMIRHPTYSAYFFWSTGLLLTTSNLLFLICIFGILAYLILINFEEKLLIKHFREEYLEYQSGTSKLFPFIW